MLSSSDSQRLTAMEAMLCEVYMEDPVAFVQEQLGYEPSEYQKEVLRYCADPDNKYIIISAGRGSGKTLLVSWIVAWSVACMQDYYPKYECVILGGSQDQSDIMYNYFRDYVYQTPLLEKRLVGDPKQRMTKFERGYVRAIAASDTSVRGRHVELLILDEVAGTDDHIIYSAMPMVMGSNHGRIIMLSTPHKFYGLFQEYWERGEEWKYRKFGPWQVANLPWIDQDFVALAKEQYPPEKFEVEFMGKFPKMTSNVFPREDIDRAVAAKPFELNPNYDADVGVDWGRQIHPTVAVLVQGIKGKFYVPKAHEWYRKPYPVQNKEIVSLCKKHRVADVYGDKSHEGENERIDEAGVPCQSVAFSTEKDVMIEHLQWRFHRGEMVISPDNEMLITQLKKYRWAEARKGGVKKTTEVKKDEDYVDALMLAMYSLIESGIYQTELEKFALY